MGHAFEIQNPQGTEGRVGERAVGSETLLPKDTLIGDNGRYRVCNIIAIGGMATVYLAQDSRLGIPCAVKALYLPATSDPADTEAFHTEGQLLAGLHFPGIVAVRDYFIEGDYAFLIEDYIDGQNLYDRHRRAGRAGEDPQYLPISPVPEDQAVLYGIALAEALACLHRQSPAIIYRDMKPHNVMRRATDGRTILLDFGIARRLRAQAKSFKSDDFGTPGYAAPEQYAEGGEIDARTDIYGLGVVLTELATGYNPRAKGAPKFLPPVESLGGSVSFMLAEILQKCIAPDPKERYQTAVELRDALLFWQESPRLIRRAVAPERDWRTDLDTVFVCPMVSSEARAYVATPDAEIVSLSGKTGAIVARRSVPPPDRKPCLRASLMALSADEKPFVLAHLMSYEAGGSVTLLDAELKPFQRFDTSKGRLMVARLEKSGRIFLGATDPAEGILLSPSPENAVLWRARLHGAPISVASWRESIVILNARGELSMIGASGEFLWHRPLPVTSGGRRLLQPAGDHILVGGTGSDRSAILVEAETGRIAAQAPGVGQPLPGPGVAGAHNRDIFVATRDAGLVVLHHKDRFSNPSRMNFTRALLGAQAVPFAPGVIVAVEYGVGGQVHLIDIERRDILWSDSVGKTGAAAPPQVCGGAILVQNTQGQVHAWRWRG